MDPVPHFPNASVRKKIKPAYNKRLFGTDYIEFLTTVVPVHHVRRIDNAAAQQQQQQQQSTQSLNAVKTHNHHHNHHHDFVESFRPNRLGEMQPSNGSLILGRYSI